MEKPRDWDNVQEFTDYSPLPAGAYICKIIQVEETKSKSGTPMVQIGLDIAEGEQTEYYRKSFLSDTRTDKKWGCVVNQTTEDKDGGSSRGFKSFITSVERSNGNQPTVWGASFCKALKGKKVGGLFRREEYINSKGENKWNTKCYRFFSVDKLAEQKIPADKPLNANVPSDAPAPSDNDAPPVNDNVPF